MAQKAVRSAETTRLLSNNTNASTSSNRNSPSSSSHPRPRSAPLQRSSSSLHDDEDSFFHRHRNTILISIGTVVLFILAFLFGEYILKLSAIDYRALDNHVASTMAKFKVKGAAVGVIVGGQILFAKGYGERDAKGNPFTTETLAQIGSTTKAFTSFVVAAVVQEGLADWSTPVTKLYPSVSFKDAILNENANLIDIMSHRTGLPRHDFALYTSLHATDTLSKIKFMPTTAPFRDRFQYQNHMFTFAGQIAGNLTGLGWEGLVHSRILGPIGMNSTCTNYFDALKMENRATGFISNDTGFYPVEGGPLIYLPGAEGAGAIWSNIDDMLRWISVILRGGKISNGTELLAPKIFQELFIPRTTIPSEELTSYGLGWFLGVFKNRPIVFHGGSTNGFAALIEILPQDDMAVVVLTNTDSRSAGFFNEAISKYILDQHTPPLSTTSWNKVLTAKKERRLEAQRNATRDTLASHLNNTSPSLPVTAAVGTYRNKAYGRIRTYKKPISKSLRKPYSLLAWLDGGFKKAPVLKANLEHWENDTFGMFELDGFPDSSKQVPLFQVKFEEGAAQSDEKEEGESVRRYQTLSLIGLEVIPMVFDRVKDERDESDFGDVAKLEEQSRNRQGPDSELKPRESTSEESKATERLNAGNVGNRVN
ncbi:hypothetical protein HDU97_008521, partial [Phlyctochytrium planicorne]